MRFFLKKYLFHIREKPFCLPRDPKSSKQSICELPATPLELFFRSPDLTKQNGFILKYDFIFFRGEGTKQTQKLLQVEENDAFQKFAAFWTSSRKKLKKITKGVV